MRVRYYTFTSADISQAVTLLYWPLSSWFTGFRVYVPSSDAISSSVRYLQSMFQKEPLLHFGGLLSHELNISNLQPCAVLGAIGHADMHRPVTPAEIALSRLKRDRPFSERRAVVTIGSLFNWFWLRQSAIAGSCSLMAHFS
jgi:hypothetical protein